MGIPILTFVILPQGSPPQAFPSIVAQVKPLRGAGRQHSASSALFQTLCFDAAQSDFLVFHTFFAGMYAKTNLVTDGIYVEIGVQSIK